MNLKLQCKSRTIYAFLMALFSVWGWGQASLPFSFDGGKSDISSTVGLSQSGIAGDYSSSPKLKFDGAGDNLILSFNGTGATLTYRLSNNSLSGSYKFQILQSVDGNTYTVLRDVTSLSTSGATFTDNVAANTRYIKWVYTTKVNGNFGLGAINLSSLPTDPNLSIVGTASNGSVCPNVSATAQVYTINNTGNNDALGVSVVSSDNQFVVSGLSSTTIVAGGSATFNLTFTPNSTGNKNSTITVSSTTSGSNTPTLTATGMGNSTVSGVVATNDASSLSYNGATLNGNVTTLSTCPNTVEKGFVYGTATGNYGTPIVVGNSVSTGAFTYDLSSLTQGTTYYYKAYIKDENGTITYGTEKSFTTISAATQLAFVNVTSGGSVNTNLPTFTVEARSNSNTLDTFYSGSVTISKASGSGNISGTLTSSFVDGVASFNDIKFDASDNYTITATPSTSITSATSGNIYIAPIYSGTGRFKKITSTNDLTDGYYVLAYGTTNAMSNNLPSTYLYSSSITTANNTNVINPSVDLVWKIQTLGSSKTLYNENVSKYIDNVGNNSTNIALSTTVSAVSKWNISVSNGGLFRFTNDSSNRVLMYNISSDRYAAYASSNIGNGYSTLTVYKYLAPTIWDGNAWSNGLPNANIDAIIAGDYSGNGFESYSLTINQNKTLTVINNQTVKTANVNNNGTFIVNDGGNFIQTSGGAYSGTGTFTVKKTGATAANKYTFWASPVASQNLNNIYTTAPTFITQYDTPTNTFVTSPSASSSIAGKGYAILNPVANASVSFAGTPNNDGITLTLDNSSNGYNLVGNPYPSDLNLGAFYTANSSRITSTFYFWDPNSTGLNNNPGYAVFNAANGANPTWSAAPNTTSASPAGTVAKIGQGFIVKATANTALSFDNTMRDAGTATFFNKNGNNSSEGKYWLKLSSSYNTNNTIAITYFGAASNAYDIYDSKAIGLGTDALYTTADAQKLVIQGRGAFTAGDVVPLASKHSTTANFTIALTQKEGVFDNGQAIYLHDKTLGIYTDLQNTPYTFTANAGEVTNRFEIVYQLGNLSTSEAQKGSFEIYRDGNDFYARNDKNIEKIEIFDAAGRKIQEMNTASKLVKIQLNAKGFYIIKAKSAGKDYTKKLTY